MDPFSVVDSKGEGEAGDDGERGDDEGGDLPALGGDDEEDDPAVEDGPGET